MTKAAVLNKIPGELEIQDVTVDKPRANEVLVRVVGLRAVPLRPALHGGPVADQSCRR